MAVAVGIAGVLASWQPQRRRASGRLRRLSRRAAVARSGADRDDLAGRGWVRDTGFAVHVGGDDALVGAADRTEDIEHVTGAKGDRELRGGPGSPCPSRGRRCEPPTARTWSRRIVGLIIVSRIARHQYCSRRIGLDVTAPCEREQCAQTPHGS
jgi:hypothetical protein